MGYHIRWAKRDDIPSILRIDRAASHRPLTEQSLERLFHQRQTICHVIEAHNEVLGFMVHILEKKFLSIERISIKPTARRQRAGMALIDKLVGKLSTQRRRYLVYRVCERDLARHLFLTKCGMTATEVIHGDCECGRDTYRFELDIHNYSPPHIATAESALFNEQLMA